MTPLTVALGFPESSRVLIVAADGLGMCHASTEAVYDSVRRGVATTGRLMVPAPWARAAAAGFRGEDIGVSLTVTAEFDQYRWGPITRGQSLVDGNGGFPSTAPDFWDHADIAETRTECRAQIERAIYWGFDVSHLDSHQDTLHFRPEFFDVELELAIEFSLPLRLPSGNAEARAGFPMHRLAAEEGVLTPDVTIDLALPATGSIEAFEAAVESLTFGVTEIRLRPAIDTPELRALHGDGVSADAQINQHSLATNTLLAAAIQRSGSHLIGYRALRQAQRSAHQ